MRKQCTVFVALLLSYVAFLKYLPSSLSSTKVFGRLKPIDPKTFNYVESYRFRTNFVESFFSNETWTQVGEGAFFPDAITSSLFNHSAVNRKILFYPRVPKCGSGTMKTLLFALARQNGFHFGSILDYRKRLRSRNEQLKVIQDMEGLTAHGNRIGRENHVYFINFELLNHTNPIQINLIRDPIQRFVSVYNWRRFGPRMAKFQFEKYLSQHEMDLMKENFTFWAWYKQNLTRCILNQKTECRFQPGMRRESLVSYFCGHHPVCLEYGNREALQRSYYHISKYYYLIGLLEDMRGFLGRLETTLPDWFRNATDKYNQLQKIAAKVRNYHVAPVWKKLVRPEVLESLRSSMQFDYDLYTFVRQHFRL